MARRYISSRIERILDHPSGAAPYLTKTASIVLSLIAMVVLFTSAAIHAGPAAAIHEQPATPQLTYEVASVKPAGSSEGYYDGDCQGIDSNANNRFKPGLGRCVFRRAPLKGLLSTAYSPVSFGGRLGFPMNQIEQADGLNWINSERFDIEAKAENSSAITEEQLYEMLRNLLADRFKLRLHRETRQVSGYLLQPSRSGSKLTPATGRETRPGMGGGPPSGGFMAGEAVPLSALVTFLSGRTGRPIRDETGLTGFYNWTLTWAPDESEVRMDGIPVVANSANPGPSLVTAVEEQLGLHLQSTKLNIEILHVDYAERPRPN